MTTVYSKSHTHSHFHLEISTLQPVASVGKQVQEATWLHGLIFVDHLMKKQKKLLPIAKYPQVQLMKIPSLARIV